MLDKSRKKGISKQESSLLKKKNKTAAKGSCLWYVVIRMFVIMLLDQIVDGESEEESKLSSESRNDWELKYSTS